MALSGVSSCAGANQLAALLGPDTAAAGIDPRRPVPQLSPYAPTMAVLPSPDSETELPCPAFQRRRCRPACCLAGSRHRRCGRRPTPPRFPSCPTPRQQWRCCRRRIARRSGLALPFQLRRCRPASACWVQTPPLRVRPTPPRSELSPGPPTIAVLPSADSATEKPCPPFPTAPVPTSSSRRVQHRGCG